MVIWVIGLSGVGKSTLAAEVVRLSRQRLANVALVDGDVLRTVWGNDLGHSLDDRKENAGRLNRLCRYLDGQGIHVVAAVLSLFEETRQWNREHLANYYEVYLKSPKEALIRRDPKGLYAKALREEILLPGVNMPFPAPQRPDLTLENNGTLESLLEHAKNLQSLLR